MYLSASQLKDHGLMTARDIAVKEKNQEIVTIIDVRPNRNITFCFNGSFDFNFKFCFLLCFLVHLFSFVLFSFFGICLIVSLQEISSHSVLYLSLFLFFSEGNFSKASRDEENERR